MARPVDARKLVARGKAKIGRGKSLAKGRSVDHLVAVALKHGGASSKRGGIDVEAKLAAARARLGGARPKA